MKSFKCPECASYLSTNAKHCSCGWIKAEPKNTQISDKRCTYTLGEKRCPLPGGISPNTSGGRWYCRRHYQTLINPKLAEAALQYIEENYTEIINTEYSNGTSKLFNK
jgi:hypothetical protein